MNGTNTLKTWGAAAALAAVLPLAAASPSFAQSYYGQGYGPCTPPAGMAVGAAGPAMSGGQLMAGVGQCRSIASWNHGHLRRYRAGWNNAYNYGGGWYGGGWGGQGPGPYTALHGRAVGPAGPAMSSGQWLAGVGQAQPVGRWGDYSATGYAIGRPYYGGPDYYGGPGNW